MTTPTRHDIAVATAALRSEAGIWSTQAGALHTAATVAGQLGFGRDTAGIFQLIVDAHADLAAALARRCTEGVDEMTHIAATLRHVADAYDDEERRSLHALRHLY